MAKTELAQVIDLRKARIRLRGVDSDYGQDIYDKPQLALPSGQPLDEYYPTTAGDFVYASERAIQNVARTIGVVIHPIPRGPHGEA